MSYQVIARKWRPQTFLELVGQDHVGVTLHNALVTQRLHHALLFTGPRGTGKTSTARILAKSIRCPEAIDHVPCNVCSECVSITQGNSVDVIEIDGASNNGVDAIRELRENVRYSPASGQYKIYIIDEVHMLSTAAFNALLKTLEEPPPHVIFIMATTEAHKIPMTILSRCQRFDFKRISVKQIAQRLKEVCQKEGNVFYDEDSLWLIAKHGDGSMRDAQSLLDQAITFNQGQLTFEKVTAALGLTDRYLVQGVLKALVEKDQPQVPHFILKLNQVGFDPKLFLEDMLELLRSAILIQAGGGGATAGGGSGGGGGGGQNVFGQELDISDSERRYLQELAVLGAPEELHLLFDMILKSIQDVISYSEPRLVFEVALLRMVMAPQVKDILNRAHTESPNHGVGVVNQSSSNSNLALNQRSQSINNSQSINRSSVGQNNTNLKPAFSSERWLDFIDKIRAHDPVFAAKIEPLVIRSRELDHIELLVPKSHQFLMTQFESPEFIAKLKNFIKQIWNSDLQVTISKAALAAPSLAQSAGVRGDEEGGQSLGSQIGLSSLELAKQKELAGQQQIYEQLLADPKVKAASLVFKGKVKLIQTNQGEKK